MNTTKLRWGLAPLTIP